MTERGEVRVGMAVSDGDGRHLGKVRRVMEAGFHVARGIWSSSEWVFLWDEVAAVRGDLVEVVRRGDDLMVLAAGGLPQSWRQELASPSSPAARG